MANIQYGNVPSSERWTSNIEIRKRKNWGCASNVYQRHTELETAPAECSSWFFAKNSITECYTDPTILRYRTEQKQSSENLEEVSNLSSMRSSGVPSVIPVTIWNGRKLLQTFGLCDSAARLWFIDKNLTSTLNLTGQPIDLNVAGFRGTSDIHSERLRVKFGNQDGTVDKSIIAYGHPNVNAVNRR